MVKVRFRIMTLNRGDDMSVPKTVSIPLLKVSFGLQVVFKRRQMMSIFLAVQSSTSFIGYFHKLLLGHCYLVRASIAELFK